MPLLGYKSPQGCRVFLLKLNIRSFLIGKKYVLYLSDLQENCPELVQSIIAAEQINNFINLNQLKPTGSNCDLDISNIKNRLD